MNNKEVSQNLAKFIGLEKILIAKKTAYASKQDALKNPSLNHFFFWYSFIYMISICDF